MPSCVQPFRPSDGNLCAAGGPGRKGRRARRLHRHQSDLGRTSQLIDARNASLQSSSHAHTCFSFFFSHRLCSSRGTAPPIVALFPNLDAITHRKRKENTCCTYTTTSPARVTKHEMKNCKKKRKTNLDPRTRSREKKKQSGAVERDPCSRQMGL